MARKQTKVSKATLLTCLVLIGFILLLLPQSTTNKLNFAFIRLFGFCLNIGANPSSYPAVDAHLGSQFVDRQTHNKLWIAYVNLQEDFFQEHKQLEKLAGLRIALPGPGTNLVPGQVTGRRGHEIIINRGSSDGLAKGQYVLGYNSIIGTVAEVSPDLSRVRLITSPASKIPVRIALDEDDIYIHPFMTGKGANQAKIEVKQTYRVKQGYRVYAAQKTGFLEIPRIIGKISRCVIDERNPVIWDITVEPACDLDNITDITVIVIKSGKD